jgi:hypothetical protein
MFSTSPTSRPPDLATNVVISANGPRTGNLPGTRPADGDAEPTVS